VDTDTDILFDELASCDPDSDRAAELRDRIVSEMLPLARNLARRFTGRGIETDDLEQVASVGLLQAVTRFDPSHGSNFLAFAVPTITGELRRHFRDHAWAMRVPRRVKDLTLSITAATETLTQRLGRSPTAPELAAELGVGTDEIIEAVAASGTYHTQSLDTPVARDGEAGATLADTLASDDDDLEKRETRLALQPILAQLPEREKRIVVMRFFEEKSQSEIARAIGISQVHVSRLLSKTFAHIRSELGG
jgi:RNA polymerase sigma-B factor